jgi:hypothetical protein
MPVMTLQQTSQDQGIAEMVAEMTGADGQLDLVPPMAMMEQHVDQETGMSNGSGYMDLLVQGSSCCLPNVSRVCSIWKTSTFYYY